MSRYATTDEQKREWLREQRAEWEPLYAGINEGTYDLHALDSLARRMRTLGFYTRKTYLGDIRYSVFKHLVAIEEER